MRYQSELAPIPRLIEDEQPPKATKLLLISRYGVAHLGHWNPEDSDIVAWCPLPKFTDAQKIRLTNPSTRTQL